MTKPMIRSELDHLLSLIGYGRLKTDVWFLGVEEEGVAMQISAHVGNSCRCWTVRFTF